MSIEVPLDQDTMSAALARIAYRVVTRYWRQLTPMERQGYTPADILYMARLSVESLQPLDTWLVCAAFAVSRGTKLRVWRDVVVQRSRWYAAQRARGNRWRRWPDPPVSNTGVRESEPQPSTRAADENTVSEPTRRRYGRH